jgi:hypothetical protein
MSLVLTDSQHLHQVGKLLETEITEKPLKRKRAIAKNRSGVNLLQGEWSFSSIDQILIDELTFYIQTNNLKAD